MILLIITLPFLTPVLGYLMPPMPSSSEPRVKHHTDIDSSLKKQIHPWLAMILDENIPICSGSIISNEVILTLAQCTMKSMASLNVWVGSRFLGREGGSRHGIKGIKRHEKYHVFGFNVSNNDIALMKVSPPFDFNERMNRVLLPDSKAVIARNTGAIYGTWIIEPWKGRAGLYEFYMEVASLLVVSDAMCSNNPGLLGPKFPGYLCVHLYSTKIGHVDSGGPIVRNGVQIGIIPWTLDEMVSQAPELYIDVSYYREWIDRWIVMYDF